MHGKRVLCIDEGWCFPDCVEVAEQAANQGFIVIITALHGFYNRTPVPIVSRLVACAERIERFNAVCSDCGAEVAGHTARRVPSAQLQLLGGTDMYVAVCRACHLKRHPPA